MKNLMPKAVLAMLMAILFVFAADKAYAKEECFKQYGGGETCVTTEEDPDLEVDKKIYNPESDDYEDHVKPKDGSNPYIFEDGDEIKFEITVKNTGDIRIEDIELKDILPPHLDDDDREIEFDDFDLDPGEEKDFTIKTEVDFDGVRPKDDYICLTNFAEAKGKKDGDDDRDVEASDYSNFCVEVRKRVKGKEKIRYLPKTGAAEAATIFGTTFAIGLMMVGYGFKKIAE